MASSSKAQAETHGGSPMDEGDPATTEALPLVASEEVESDTHSDFDPISTGSGPSEGILARPTLDPWYESGKLVPSVSAEARLPPAGWEWLVKREDAVADAIWVPPFQEILDLKIQRKDILAVPIKFNFQYLRASNWEAWVDKEFADAAFCTLLEQAGVLQAILISRSSSMYQDTESLRQMVRRWCPSTHTFFFAHGELTVTLKDVKNHWRLPILGDYDLSEIELSHAELKAETILLTYVGKKNTSLGTNAARLTTWPQKFFEEKDDALRKAAFVAYWLSKCIFGEYPSNAIKPLYFRLTVKISAGTSFPLAAMFLGHFYTQLDLLHTDEMTGERPSDSRQKFANMPKAVAARFEFLWTSVPSIYRWVGAKFYNSELVPSLDEEDFVLWRPYGASHRGYSCDSIMSCTTIPEVVIPSGERVGIYTMGMNHYWRDLMASMLEFRNNGHESIEHLFPLCKAPSPNLQLFVATNTVTTYATKQGSGYVVWRSDLSKWMTNSKRHPSTWLEENPNNVPAPEKVASKRGKRITAAASSSKRKKSVAQEKSISKGIVIREPITATFQSGEQAVPKDVSGKKIARKTRAKRKRSTALLSPTLHESPSSNTRSKKPATTTYSKVREEENSSTSLEDDDAGASVEEVPITIDEIIVSEVTAIETTAAVEPADSITTVAETVGDAAVVSDAFEEDVNAAKVAAEEVVEEPEGAVTVGVVGDDGLTQGGSSRSSDHMDSALLDSSPSSKFYVRRSRRVNVVSSNSERTPSVSAALLTPWASQSESAGASSMHVTPAPPPIAADAPLGAPGAENIQGDKEDVAIPDHISGIDVDAATKGVTAAGIIPTVEVSEVEHIESKMEVIHSTEVEDDIPDIEGNFA
uniref:Aminotransferase-like plant mobile domain-containing protein n=1 Tax=Fagus sylvatica TaxID=28930 RepID=A0A2N9H2H3_FAGSY